MSGRVRWARGQPRPARADSGVSVRRRARGSRRRRPRQADGPRQYCLGGGAVGLDGSGYSLLENFPEQMEGK
eukprot:4879862-Prymnesium_polylepis.1